MTEREKVLTGLECCTNSLFDPCPHHCPYYAECTNRVSFAPLLADAAKLLKEQKEEQSDWISVKERMPVELHSIFWPWYGKKQWSNAMWREQSDKVLATVAFKDGTRLVTTGETHDGIWHTAISRTLDPVVTYWMQFPEPPKEENK